ncbi:hypothetical protein D3C79_1077260 [compost metagenome]
MRNTPTPLLVLAGNDVHHPAEISRELAALAPRVQLIEEWRGESHRSAYLQGVLDFLEKAEQSPPK